MRIVGWLLVILLLLGWALSEVPVTPPAPREPPEIEWRRARDGWQRRSTWTDPTVVRHPRLHPMIVGTLQLLVSVGVLIAMQRPSRQDLPPETILRKPQVPG